MKAFKLTYLYLALMIGPALKAQNFDIYVCDAGNFNTPPWNIFRYDSSGANPEVFINKNLAWPQDILFLEDSGIVLISNLNTNTITKYHSETGEYLGIFASGMNAPTRIKIGPDSLLYVLQWQGNGRIKRYLLDGSFHSDFSTMGVIQSIGMDWDKKGNLYVSSFSGKSVRKFGPKGADSGLFVTTNLAGPTNIWLDENDELLVVDYSGTAVRRYDTNGVFKGNFIIGLGKAEGVAFLPNGNILVGNGDTRSVMQFSSTGAFINNIVPTSSGGLIAPNAVIIREKQTVVSIPENSDERPKVILNTGKQFYFDNTQHEIEQVDIVNLQGQRIQSRLMKGRKIWDARDVPSGVYLFILHHQSGKQSSQKIVVNK